MLLLYQTYKTCLSLKRRSIDWILVFGDLSFTDDKVYFSMISLSRIFLAGARGSSRVSRLSTSSLSSSSLCPRLSLVTPGPLTVNAQVENQWHSSSVMSNANVILISGSIKWRGPHRPLHRDHTRGVACGADSGCEQVTGNLLQEKVIYMNIHFQTPCLPEIYQDCRDQ